MSEKTVEKGILARTATYTSKKARRAQTKLKQRVGKGDETKDEVFDEFVNNFNKQQTAASRLYTELRNYLRCVTAMQLAANNFGEAFKEVYEEDWTSRDKLTELFMESDSNWTTLSKRLTEEVLEPLASYQKPFSDVKNKIQKRARKLVDYDHTRHTVDTLRAKGATKSSDAKRLNQAEDDYQKARDVFIDLTSDLYEELPALFDSRIGFYVSCFQSIFTLEEVFHREASKIEHQLNDLMDQLINDFSAGTYSTRKPFCAGLETTSNSSEKVDQESEAGGLAQFYDVAVPESDDISQLDVTNDSVDSVPSKPSLDELLHDKNESENSDKDDIAIANQPVRPAPVPPSKHQATSEVADTTPVSVDVKSHEDEKVIDLRYVKSEDGSGQTSVNENQMDNITLPVEQVANDEPNACAQDTDVTQAEGLTPVIAYKNVKTADNPDSCNLVVPSSLYKVVATHKYTSEDEDELSFEKGEVIHVIPYDDPDEQDEGWLMGVVDATGLTGVFPENFSKKYET